MTRALAAALCLAAIGCGHDRAIDDAIRARERFVRELAAREGLVDVWSLSSRSDLEFADGLGPIELLDPDVPFTGWDEVAHRCESTPALPVRWMGPRAHLRLRGDRDGDRRLEIRGRVDVKAIQTQPIVTASIDGREFHSGAVDAEGYFLISAAIPAAWVAEWADVYVTLSSVHEPYKDPEGRAAAKLTVARLEGVIWEPRGP
jgi:hypothetical protein